MDIQISNLNQSLIEADIQRLFAPFGELGSLIILRDKLNNRSKGQALIKMPVAKQALHAIASLNGTVLSGKSIVVDGIADTDENRFLGSMTLK